MSYIKTIFTLGSSGKIRIIFPLMFLLILSCKDNSRQVLSNQSKEFVATSFKVKEYPCDNFKIISQGVYYWDSISVQGKGIYRKFTGVSEEPFFAKPQKIDVKIEFNQACPDYLVQVNIEELMIPLRGKVGEFDLGPIISDTTWVLHKVVYSNLIRKNEVVIKDIPYQTAYYYSSYLYMRGGFRVITLVFDKKGSQIVDKLEDRFINSM
ncbi:MAG: hypothetical protein R3B93_19125 [Bacteroidia bacterium]